MAFKFLKRKEKKEEKVDTVKKAAATAAAAAKAADVVPTPANSEDVPLPRRECKRYTKHNG